MQGLIPMRTAIVLPYFAGSRPGHRSSTSAREPGRQGACRRAAPHPRSASLSGTQPRWARASAPLP
eukprot:2188617-Pyramimonas_sp.AAC.1